MLPLHDYDRLRRAGVRAPLPDTGGAPPPKAGGWQSYLILRDSFEDVAVFSSPKDVKLASGASLTWSNDRIAANRSWTAKGVAAYPIVWQNPDNPAPRSSFDPYLVGLAFTPTVAINRVTNSNAQLVKNNIDVLTFGGAAEFAVGHMFDETTTDPSVTCAIAGMLRRNEPLVRGGLAACRVAWTGTTNNATCVSTITAVVLRPPAACLQ